MNTKLKLIKDSFGYKHTDWEEMMKIPDFPDKTLFIREVFKNEFKTILITAPANFGKTINLGLLKKFVEIPVDTNGLIYGLRKLVNYEFFKNNNFQIFRDSKFFQENFSTHPVIHVRYMQFNVDNFNEAVDWFGSDFNSLFGTHSYLLKSSKLSAEEISKFREYQNERLCINRIITALDFLSECLSKHFDGKKVFLLIDDYDAPIESNMDYEMFPSIRKVYDLLSQIISGALDSEFIEKAVITGCQYFDIFKPSSSQVGKYLIMDDHPFKQFYGITESEVDTFVADLSFDDERIKNYKEFSNGYVTFEGTKLFSIHSLLCFLVCKQVNIDFSLHTFIFEAHDINILLIKYAFEKLCLNQSLVIEIIEKFDMKHIKQIRKTFSKQDPINFQLKKPDVFLNYILNKGWLNYERVPDSNYCKVKLENNDVIIKGFKKQLHSYYEYNYARGYSVNKYLKECAEVFDKISPNSEDDTFRDFLAVFNRNFRKLGPSKHVRNQNFMFDILCKTNFTIGDQLTFTMERPNLIFYKGNVGVIVKIVSKKSPEFALKQIIERYVSNEKLCLKNVTQWVYLGLNVDKKIEVSMSVLINSTDLSDAKCF